MCQEQQPLAKECNDRLMSSVDTSFLYKRYLRKVINLPRQLRLALLTRFKQVLQLVEE